MTEILLNWEANSLASSDVIDLYFIISDLVDIPLSQAELCEMAYYDSMAMDMVGNANGHSNIPLGKLVL